MSDLTERLRECQPPNLADEEMCREAAAEIERLQHDVNRLIATNTELATENERLQAEVEGLKKAIAESCEDDRQQILERGWGGCMEAHKLQARVEELEGALHDAFDVYTKNPNASGDDVARAMWDLLGEALQETE